MRVAFNVDIVEALAGGMDVEAQVSVGDASRVVAVTRGHSLPSWLHGRIRWGASFAIIPTPTIPPLIVARLGFFDIVRGDVPILWTNRWPR